MFEGVGSNECYIDYWEVDDLWKGSQLFPDWEAELSSITPRAKWWTESSLLWGEESGNRIEVFIEDGKTSSVCARLDARSVDLELVRRLADFAAKNDCVFYTEDEEVLEPDLTAILDALASSNAARFVADPRKFLDELPESE